VQHGIEQVPDTQPRESRLLQTSDAFDRADRNFLQQRSRFNAALYGSNTMIASTSTPAPRGSDATPIAARAG
jgi:hypothetical protein